MSRSTRRFDIIGRGQAPRRRLACMNCRSVYRAEFDFCPVDGTRLVWSDSDPLVDTILAGRYWIEAVIGTGAMGMVYRATHRESKERFAIKVLLGDVAADAKARKRFSREAQITSALDHPNVVPVVDFGAQSGLVYLVMPYVFGPTLRELVSEHGPVEQERAIKLGIQMCFGLQHVHQRALVHRDFKPGNVLVAQHEGLEQARIFDFGLAVLPEFQEDGCRLTTDGLAIGTPAFMAPEQCRGETVDRRADLFSLGVVLYEMLSGRLPFDGKPAELARKNTSRAHPSIADRTGVQVEPALEAVVSRLLAKHPLGRYHSAVAVAQALARIPAPLLSPVRCSSWQVA